MKITISKSKDGKGYYTKLKNKYNNEEYSMYLSVQLKQGLSLEYGTYDVDCFLSCYKSKDGSIKPKLVVTGLKQETGQEQQKSGQEQQEQTDIYAQFGTTITAEEIDESNLGDLPF